MFTKEDTGKTIIINNTQGHKSAKKGVAYTITQVHNSKTVRLNDTFNWICQSEKDYEIIGEKSQYEIGDEVVLKSATTSLDKGYRAKIIDFYDDKQKKLVIEGLIPGGWVDSSKVFKLLDHTKYRVKTLSEFIRDMTTRFYNEFRKPDKVIFTMFGKSLSDIGEVYQQDSDYIYVTSNKRTIILENYMICSIDIPLFNSKIVITTKEKIKEFIGNDTWGVFEHSGKDITEVYPKLSYDKPVTLFEFFKCVGETYYSDGKCKVTWQLIQLESEINKKEVEPTLPF